MICGIIRNRCRQVSRPVADLVAIELEDQPQRTPEAGDVLFVPARVFHSARTLGATRGSELATYVLEKGQQLTEFAE